ncbi:hypothetical protein HN588_07045 [Candidatus Bathyarchaeota archaeon]|jgi:hypothetical protein|nr:hypothetical protein [Candidatus Bathyarchaeota archaeon]
MADSDITGLPEAEPERVVHNFELDGLEVSLYRGSDGKLIVDIDSEGLEEADAHPSTMVPNIRIWVNEQKIEFAADGELLES